MFVITRHYLGTISHDLLQGHFDACRRHWLNALEMYERLKNYFEAAMLCIDLGDLYFEVEKNWWGAGHYYDKALSLFERDSKTSLANIGIVCHKLSEVFSHFQHLLTRRFIM
jgi:tetratricopeptide (TPR) repeat protein